VPKRPTTVELVEVPRKHIPIDEVLDHIIREKLSKTGAKRRTKVTPQHLTDKLALLKKHHVFKAGDIVRWKAGLKNRRFPIDDEPAVVVEVLRKPIADPSEQSTGSPYFNAPLDFVLGVIDSDGDFLTFYSESRRFEPYSTKAAK